MNVFDHLRNDYNYYPIAAIELSVIAYNLMDFIPMEVQDNKLLDQTVVWGPAELDGLAPVPYSKMFVSKRNNSEEYFVVIQGTNPMSLTAWTKEDFDVHAAVSMAKLKSAYPITIPKDVVISKGSFNGIQYLLELVDPKTGVGMIEFLKAKNPQYVYVTGHSLGGTLTPPMFVYLNDILFGGGEVENMALWSFAGLTPGGTTFNAYFNNVLMPNQQSFKLRIQNSLDVAPLMWGDLEGIKTIYEAHGLPLEGSLRLVIDGLFAVSHLSGAHYKQAQTGVVMPGKFQLKDGALPTWYEEASMQHSSINTYRHMVKEYYGHT